MFQLYIYIYGSKHYTPIRSKFSVVCDLGRILRTARADIIGRIIDLRVRQRAMNSSSMRKCGQNE